MLSRSQMSQKLSQFFREKADEQARETKLVQRQSKLTGGLFLQIWVLGFLEKPTASLNYLCQVAEDLGLLISKQGLQKRLTAAAVTFMKAMFEEAKLKLQQQVPLPLTVLTQFATVQLVDSTGMALPDKLAADFPGCGGSGPDASLKLQTMWDFLRGNLTAIWQTNGRDTDAGFSDHLTHITPGSLLLADLGYFVLTSFQQIVDKQAYYISRFNTQTALLDPQTKERFDLLAHLQQTTDSKLEMTLLMGVKAQLPTRLLAVRLPDEVVAERRRKAKAKARKKGRTLSQTASAWLAWSLFITNVPSAMLSLADVVLLYSLRWQIELLFKLWKSEGQLDRVAGRKRERLLCELYVKLIGFVIFHFLTAPVRWGVRELSPTKAFQTLRRHSLELNQALASPATLYPVLTKLTRRWQRYALKDQRRQCLSTCRQIALAASRQAAPKRLPAFTASAPTAARQLEPQLLSPVLFWQLVLVGLFGVHHQALSPS